jgi:hypothetical protein
MLVRKTKRTAVPAKLQGHHVAKMHCKIVGLCVKLTMLVTCDLWSTFAGCNCDADEQSDHVVKHQHVSCFV